MQDPKPKNRRTWRVPLGLIIRPLKLRGPESLPASRAPPNFLVKPGQGGVASSCGQELLTQSPTTARHGAARHGTFKTRLGSARLGTARQSLKREGRTAQPPLTWAALRKLQSVPPLPVHRQPLPHWLARRDQAVHGYNTAWDQGARLGTARSTNDSARRGRHGSDTTYGPGVCATWPRRGPPSVRRLRTNSRTS